MFGAFVNQVAQGFFAHFARADDEDMFVVKSLEYTLRKIGDGDAGDTNSFLLNGGFGSDAFGDTEGRLKGSVGERAGRAGAGGELVGLLHLTENLGFADDHAVEAGCDGEEVPDEVFAGVLKELAEDLIHVEAVKLGQECDDVVVRGAGVGDFAGKIELDAITRREQHGFGLWVAAAEARKRFRGLLAAEGELFAKLDGSCVVAATDHAEVHACASVTRGGAWARG